MMSESKRVKFVVTYRSGGDYTAEHVAQVYNTFCNHSSHLKWQFICYTDEPFKVWSKMGEISVDCAVPDPTVKTLKHDWPGWWSIVEMFRETGPVVSTGLDTVFTGNIDCLTDLALQTDSNDVYMLRPFNAKRPWAGCKFLSGIIVRNGNWRYVYDGFENAKAWIMDYYRLGGEQKYTYERLQKKGANIKYLQDAVGGIYSYKFHCRDNGAPPDGARAIMFHGDPRPFQCREQWIKDELGKEAVA